jgi:hypothetical protein
MFTSEFHKLLRMHCIVLESLLAKQTGQTRKQFASNLRETQNWLVAALAVIVKAETKTAVPSRSHTV